MKMVLDPHLISVFFLMKMVLVTFRSLCRFRLTATMVSYLCIAPNYFFLAMLEANAIIFLSPHKLLLSSSRKISLVPGSFTSESRLRYLGIQVKEMSFFHL